VAVCAYSHDTEASEEDRDANSNEFTVPITSHGVWKLLVTRSSHAVFHYGSIHLKAGERRARFYRRDVGMQVDIRKRGWTANSATNRVFIHMIVCVCVYT